MVSIPTATRWLSGSLAYTNGPHALSFVAGGNLGQTAFQTFATPVQNNGSIYNVIYTYTKGPWIVQPYFQYTNVPTNAKIGIVKGASTTGGAILASYAFKHGFSLPVRWEYIASSGSAAQNAVNLMYGPGSTGTSFTVTPTFQQGGFFARGDIAWTHVGSFTPGAVFGPAGPGQQPVPGRRRNWLRVWRQYNEETIRTAAPTRAFTTCMTSTVSLAPADSFNAYVNFDFGRNSSPTGVTTTCFWPEQVAQWK